MLEVTKVTTVSRQTIIPDPKQQIATNDCSSNIELFVTDVITEEVTHGIKLYGSATGELTADSATDRAQRWLSLFRDNSLGKGLFAIAKYQGDLVGFISLIDFEMLVRGIPIRAGKAEFWTVRQDALKLTLPGADTRLPWSLFQYIREQARNYGYDAILTVSPKAARYLRRAGDLCISTSLTSYYAPGHKGTGRIGRYLDQVLRHRRLAAILSNLSTFASTRKADIDEIETLNVEVGYTNDSALISSNKAMINMRFPSQWYLKYLLSRPQKAPLLFVFDRPTQGSRVNLVHWSGMPETFEEFAPILHAILTRVKEEDANLVIEAPIDQFSDNYRLVETGFLKAERRLEDIYLMEVNKEVRLDSVPRWQITHGHMGFYSYIK